MNFYREKYALQRDTQGTVIKLSEGGKGAGFLDKVSNQGFTNDQTGRQSRTGNWSGDWYKFRKQHIVIVVSTRETIGWGCDGRREHS